MDTAHEPSLYKMQEGLNLECLSGTNGVRSGGVCGHPQYGNERVCAGECVFAKQMLHLYRVLVRFGLEYGCQVYVSASPSSKQ